MSVPYERFVQWAAGPISIAAGYGATLAETHLGVMNDLGISPSQVSKGIIVSSTFVVGTLVTYAAHHKWLDNLSKWWVVTQPTADATLPDGIHIPVGVQSEVDMEMARITAQGTAADAVQVAGATPAAFVDHGLSPDPIGVNPTPPVA